jgi:hypothetical protein
VGQRQHGRWSCRRLWHGESVGADLNISRQFDDGRRMDLHIDVERNSGFPWRSPYNYYGSRYQGH